MPPNSYLLYEICYLSLADKSTFNSAEGGIIKQMCWLINSFRHTSRLRAMNLDNVIIVIGNYSKCVLNNLPLTTYDISFFRIYRKRY